MKYKGEQNNFDPKAGVRSRSYQLADPKRHSTLNTKAETGLSATANLESAATDRPLDTDRQFRISLDLQNEPLRQPREFSKNPLALHSQSSGKDLPKTTASQVIRHEQRDRFRSFAPADEPPKILRDSQSSFSTLTAPLTERNRAKDMNAKFSNRHLE